MHEPTNRSETVELTGLSIASPMGFMAALGLLRVCAEDHGLPVQLSWTGSHARLHGIEGTSLRELLLNHMRGRWRAPEFNFEVIDDQGKPCPVMHIRTLTSRDFRAAVEACRDSPRALRFLASYATDAVITYKGFVTRSQLDFTSGQQRLMKGIRKLGQDLAPDAKRPSVPLAVRIDRSLFGGPYETRHTLGWDPASLMTHAHQPHAPTDSDTPGQPMTIWLAVEALPLHPVVPTGPRAARTTGFDGIRAYVWPQWHEPLSLPEVELLRQRPVATLAALSDVVATWSSSVTSVGDYGFLRPATRTSSDSGTLGQFALQKSWDATTS